MAYNKKSYQISLLWCILLTVLAILGLTIYLTVKQEKEGFSCGKCTGKGLQCIYNGAQPKIPQHHCSG